jgi:hypothetical protein
MENWKEFFILFGVFLIPGALIGGAVGAWTTDESSLAIAFSIAAVVFIAVSVFVKIKFKIKWPFLH